MDTSLFLSKCFYMGQGYYNQPYYPEANPEQVDDDEDDDEPGSSEMFDEEAVSSTFLHSFGFCFSCMNVLLEPY